MAFVVNELNDLKGVCELKTWINFKGNWNKGLNVTGVFTKPIGNFSFVKDGDELEYSFCLSHKDLLHLIKLYVEADFFSVKMIDSKLSGEVSGKDVLLVDKIRFYLDVLEKEFGGERR